jgi:hypothetical protein
MKTTARVGGVVGGCRRVGYAVGTVLGRRGRVCVMGCIGCIVACVEKSIYHCVYW